MRILILGGGGMAGHVIKDYLSKKPQYEVFYTTRDLSDKNSIYLEVHDLKSVERVVEAVHPEVVVNCVGILNDFAERDPLYAFQINSVLPHQLAKLCERQNGKLIHISTDCVFSGSKGDYSEDDPPDGTSVYAQSKQLGEIISDRHLTIRTSIIGPELKEEGIGLLLWFMKQSGTIKGFKNVLWNGVTTLELAKAIDTMIEQKVTGLYHLASPQKISKYELLLFAKKILKKENITIIPDDDVVLDRTIKNTRTDFSYLIPSYEKMLEELKEWMDQHETER